MLWTPVSAKIAAQRGDFEEAIALAAEAVALAETCDGLNRSAAAQMDLGEVLLLAGRASEAASALSRCDSGSSSEKGNVVGAMRVRTLEDDPALV